MKRVVCILFSMSLTGCVDMPTYEQAAAQDYGPPITQADAEPQARNVMTGLLKDPESARWECREPEKGWIGSGKAWGSATYYGWVLVCMINGKNSYGAYAGAQEYRFLFQNGTLMRAAIFANGGIMATQQVVYDR